MNTFNEKWQVGQRLAGRHQPDLQRKYESAFRAQATKSRNSYMGQGLTSSADPNEVKPTGDVSPEIPGGIINESDFKKSVKARTLPVRKKMVNEVAVSTLGPTVAKQNQEVFATLIELVAGKQADNAFLAAEDAVHSSILEGITNGLSVSQTADRIGQRMNEWAAWQAQRQAQTDLVALANGASLESAKVLGQDAPQTKTWLSAGDDAVRETHQAADGQTVPLNDSFTVGGFPMDHPGDFLAPDSEVINCRCTLIYGFGENAQSGQDVLAMAADGGGNPNHDEHGRFDFGAGHEAPAKESSHEDVALSAGLSEVEKVDALTTNPVFMAKQDGETVAVKPESMLNPRELRDAIPPGGDLVREEAAYKISERIKQLDPSQAVDVPEYRIMNDDRPGGFGKVGVGKWVEGETAGKSVADWRPGTRNNESFYDSIIGNQDRNYGNVIVRNEGKDISLIDHGLAFPENNDARTGQLIGNLGDLKEHRLGLLKSLKDNRNVIDAEDLKSLSPASREAFWGRVDWMQERGRYF